jgi:small-conductance mechanosensitive channel
LIQSDLSTTINNLTGLSISISWETLIFAVGLLAGGWLLNKLSNILIQRGIKRRGGDKHASATAKKVSAYVIYTLTLVAVLGVFGVPLSALGTAVGLIGLGISFALKDIIANFISGLMIMINRPFKIGDQITAAGESGTVQDIQVRATTVRTYDGRMVIIPNSQLYSDVVVNNTAYDLRRFEVIVGISYDDDIEKAKELAMEVLEDAETVEDDPEPQVLVNELGGSSVDLKLRGWTSSTRAGLVQASSEVTGDVKDRYDEAGIDIPYPIRTVFMNEE